MASYFIIEIEKVTNQRMYQKYLDSVQPIIQKHHGEYVLKSGKIVPFAGNWKPLRILVIKFPSIEQLHQCFDSEAYCEIKKYRETSVIGKAVIIEN